MTEPFSVVDAIILGLEVCFVHYNILLCFQNQLCGRQRPAPASSKRRLSSVPKIQGDLDQHSVWCSGSRGTKIAISKHNPSAVLMPTKGEKREGVCPSKQL